MKAASLNTELVPGTRLVATRRGYRHHGIYSGRGHVIHYAGRGRYPLGCIEEISLQEFMGTRPFHVGIAPDVVRGRDIVQRARLRLGECHYDVLSNNCEHFCAWCELGEPRSPQIESLTKPVRLLVQAAVTLGPHWTRFLSRASLLASDAVLAERICRAAPQIHILATSRKSLRAEGEYVHELPRLEAPPDDSALTAAKALAFPAVRFFVEHASADGNRIELNDADARVAAGFCRRLDGIALALELAAGSVRPHGIRGTTELLEQRFGLLWQGRRTALPKHRTQKEPRRSHSRAPDTRRSCGGKDRGRHLWILRREWSADSA